MSCTLSGHASWSLIISGVNNSAWEVCKPFALVYTGWIVIELSYLRPSLLRFVCAKITGEYVFFLCGLISVTACFLLPEQLQQTFAVMAVSLSVIAAQMVSYFIYNRHIRAELLCVPLLFSFGIIILLLIILTFYPPHFPPFYDYRLGLYGRTPLYEPFTEYTKM